MLCSTTNLFHESSVDDCGNQILNYAKLWLRPFRFMYWTDWGRQPKIERAWMDGQQRQTLVSEDLGWPTGLSIDYLNNDRIYWSDSKENIIESMRPDGTDRTVVLHGGKNLLWNPWFSCAKLDFQELFKVLVVFAPPLYGDKEHTRFRAYDAWVLDYLTVPYMTNLGTLWKIGFMLSYVYY